jgi:ribosomal protein S18 acetylase RimI-like enzyme
MQENDIPFAVKLCDQEKWGVTRDDLERILRLDPKGSLIASDGARKVGLTTSTSYGKKLAWIGNVIVDREERGRAIGRTLIEHSVAHLRSRGIRHVVLYCFEENVRFYKLLGFARDTPFARLSRNPKPTNFPFSAHDFKDAPRLKELLRLDRKAFGANRSELIRRLTAKRIGYWITSSHRSGFHSYLMVRKYKDLCELGPWISSAQRKYELTRMLRQALNESGELPIEISSLSKNQLMMALLRDHGFRVVRQGYRMFYDEAVLLGDDHRQCALGFLDKG